MAGAPLIFSGEFTHQLDEKVRFKLPKKMEELFTDELGLKCYLMKMPERCLALYPHIFWNEEFGRYLDFVKSKMPGNAKYRAYTRLIASNSYETKIGAQGRVALTDSHKEYIGVEGGGNVVVVGAGERIEIWSEEAWEQQQGEDMAQFHNLLEDVAAEMEKGRAAQEEDSE